MSKEHLAALIGKKPEELEDTVTIEEFERLDGTVYKAEVIKYDLTKEALVSNCKKFYANRIKKAKTDAERDKLVLEREKRCLSIVMRG